MPAKSCRQRRLFAAALRCKRTGKSCFPKAKNLANSLSERELRKFASVPQKGACTERRKLLK